MSEQPMDTETALSTVVDRIKATDLRETYFIARKAVEGASVNDNEYTVDVLQDTVDMLRAVLVDILKWPEMDLDEQYSLWLVAGELN